ncbi:MAG: DNA gyrase C-terminal beta-propeller domain-containing protein, partial [Anaerolineae bacterium]
GALKHYINHRRIVIVRRTEFELDRARRRAHILEGLLIAIANLDAVIRTIRESEDANEARTQLMEIYDLSEEQAQAILDMQLRRLAALERLKIEEEYQQLLELIEELEDLLASPRKVLLRIREDLLELAEKYGDERQTRVIPADDELDEEALIPDEDVLVTITRQGYIKRVSASNYRLQGRAGKGVRGLTTRNEDDVLHFFTAGSRDYILYFTNRGKVYQEKAYQIPDAGRTAKGLPLASILMLAEDEYVTAALAVPHFDEVEYCTMVTRLGRIKRVEVTHFEAVRPSGLIAISLDEGDQLGWVKLTTGDQDLLIVTVQGQAIRFHENQVRAMGRTAAGVNAIRLQDDDVVAAMDVILNDEEQDLLVVTERAIGKRTPVSEYPSQGRYGLGVRTLKSTKRSGSIIGARIVSPGDRVSLMTTTGMTIRMLADSISRYGRNTQGVQLMDLGKGDSVVSIALLEEERRRRRREALAEENETLSRSENGSEPDLPS